MSQHASTPLSDACLSTWRTSHRVTIFLLENLPEALWPEKVPGTPRKTVRMICGHLHNTRRMWIKSLGKGRDIAVPEAVDRHRVSRRELITALDESSDGVLAVLRLGLEQGGRLVGFRPDAAHLLAYLIAHEAHHRGQICLIARQLGHRLPEEVTYGLWHWSKRAKETGTPRAG